MKFRFIFTFVLVLVFLATGVNADTYLNTCGKNTGWINGETYYINFTQIPVTYLNTYCFRFLNTDANNINFIGTGNITNLANQNLNFMFTERIHLTGLTFSNININKINNFMVIRGGYYTNEYVNDTTFEDIYINEIGNDFILHQDFVDPSPYQSLTLSNSLFNRITIKNSDTFIENLLSGTNGYIYDNEIKNSYIAGNQFIDNQFGVLTYRNVVEDCVLNIDTAYETATGNITSSIYKNYFHIDDNGDGFADSDIYTNMFDMKTYKSLIGYNFFQDVEEGQNSFTLSGVDTRSSIFINDEVISSTWGVGVVGLPIPFLSEFLGTILFDKINGFSVGGGIDCLIFTLGKCYLQDSPTYTGIITSEYKGLMLVNNNDIIQNVDFHKIASNNGHIISNSQDVQYNPLTITNNNFTKADNNFRDNNNFLIKLKGQNVLIRNNTFNLITSLNGSYEILSIESSNAISNEVTLNNFSFSYPAQTPTSVIFANSWQNTAFYNNYVGTNIIVSDFGFYDVIINPMVSIVYNNKIYYWAIGNYYEDNSGCVDSDVNGICDDYYMSGLVNDSYPISSYPFEPLQHLLTADLIIPLTDYNITIGEPSQNETITISSSTDTITLDFSQDSDYIDLICYYVIDNSTIATQNYPNKNFIYNIGVIDWLEKNYEFRVECVNEDYGYKASDTIYFDVVFSGGEEPPTNETENGLNGNGVTIGNLTGGGLSGIFSGDSETTTDNILGIFSLTNTPLTYLLILGFVFVGLTFLTLLFAIPMAMVWGKK